MFVSFDIYLEADETEKHRDEKKPGNRPGDCRSSDSSVTATALSKERVLKKILKEWIHEEKVFGVCCVPVDNNLRRKYSFQAVKYEADDIYERLTYNGFGAPGSRSIIITNDNKFCEGCVVESHEEEHNAKTRATDLVKCLRSIQSQLTVHEVLANVRAKGQVSLDSVFQVITAGMIAMTGLAMDDPVIVVASMFIAPLMDVINMVTFAIRIQSKSDIVMGAKIFVLYIVIMMSMAFVLGKPMQEWSRMLNIYMYGEEQLAYPTKQMTNRGHYFSLIGVFVLAVCSSLSSYSSMLNGYNFNVHIGNAISLSLVPPVMNCGMMFVFGLDMAVYLKDAHLNSTNPCLRAYALCDVHQSNSDFNSSLASCVKTSQQIAMLMRAQSLVLDHQPKLCRYPRVAFFEAFVSLSITFLTALIVILMGLALMWMKKFTPTRLDKNHVAEFYKNDLDAYVQDSHRTVRQRSHACFINGLRSELLSKNLTVSDCEMALELAQRTEHFQSIAAGLGVAPIFTKMDSETPFRRRLFSRQASENQRTIYDTYAPIRYEVDAVTTVDSRFGSIVEKNDAKIDESSPLRGSQSVGRFQITCPDPHSPTI